jgi:DNA primase
VAADRSLELRVVELPPGSDPADLAMAEGAEAMRARVAASVPFARFRAERVLAGADLSSTDGRDRALGELRGVLGALPASTLREELVRLAAGRLGLSEQLVASLAAAPSGASAGEARPRRSRGPLDRREETERTFLALCIALPRVGRQALADVDVERHFTSATVRRAATHLREHLTDPLAGLDPQEGELSALLAELTLRASRQPSDPGALRVQAVQLEVARLDREIARARAEGGLDVSDLAAERLKVRARLDDAMDEAMEERSPA